MTQRIGMRVGMRWCFNCFYFLMTSSNHSPETKDVGFATKYEDLFASIQYFSMCFAAAEKVLWPIICLLSCNNRPITDYLKNGRLIGFADYLPINRLIPKSNSASFFWDTR